MGLIRDIRAIYDNYGFKTEILAASIRSVSHVREAALAGADVATMPPEIFKKLHQPSPDRQGLGRLPRRRQEGACDDQDRLTQMAHGAMSPDELQKLWLVRARAMSGAPAPTPCAPMATMLRAFWAFSAAIWAARSSEKALAKLRPADIRAFITARRGEGLGAGGVQRALAAVRSFYRFLAREGILENAAPRAVRTPAHQARPAAALERDRCRARARRGGRA